ncbi:uncharacterized protein LOC125304202 [Alosa alosa]|uniref:uncharacterized protein LOC125304202 n=1 Tax=Alosa alosa TaxID=278164 RepID=UPI0020150556|nr:uncharacterized protein LOC125304202 [Alosa alosa]
MATLAQCTTSVAEVRRLRCCNKPVLRLQSQDLCSSCLHPRKRLCPSWLWWTTHMSFLCQHGQAEKTADIWGDRPTCRNTLLATASCEQRNIHLPSAPFSQRNIHLPATSFSQRNIHLPATSFSQRNIHLPATSFSQRNIHLPATSFSQRNIHLPATSFSQRNIHLPATSFSHRHPHLSAAHFSHRHAHIPTAHFSHHLARSKPEADPASRSCAKGWEGEEEQND